MSKKVTFGNEAHIKVKRGVDLIANSIKETLGPRGRNVVYSFHHGYPQITKDGVTVARNVDCVDQTEQIGLLLVRQVAQKTVDDVGDGTTTASILFQSIYNEGIKTRGTGANPILIQRGIDSAVEDVVKFINKHTQKDSPPEQLLRVATISANNDEEIGRLVCSAIEKAGENGVITIEDNYQDSNMKVDTIDGMQFNEGYLSEYFVTNLDKMEAVYDNPYILIVDHEIGHPQALMRIAEAAIQDKKRPLVIVCHNLVGPALSSLVASKCRNGIPILACKAPDFGDNRSEKLSDLATLTGGKVVSAASGVDISNLTLEDLGQVHRIISNKYSTTFIGGKGSQEAIDSRIKLLQSLIDGTESDYRKEKLQERLAKLTCGVAVIKVWANTEVKLKEKKSRIEDSLHATRAAMEEGIVPGGGVMLLKASKYLSKLKRAKSLEEQIGRDIIIKALREPIRQIAINAGMVDANEIIAKILSRREINYGYDFLTKKDGDLIKMGVIDPAKVVRLTTENAASVAGMLITKEVVINEEIEDEIVRTPRPRSE